jgi:CHAD domain-containing protein
MYRLLRRRYRKWRQAAKELTAQSDATAFHEVRILLKKLRYGVDAARPLASKGAGRLVDATKVGQDLLGEHQDCYVAVDRLRELVEAKGASLPPPTVFRMGELMEQRRNRMRELRAAWPRAYGGIRSNWRPFARSIRGKTDGEREAEASEEPSERPPRQRPFWLWQRFFRAGNRR